MSLARTSGPTVLVSSAGRRVELLRSFRRAIAAVDSPHTHPEARAGRVLATDASWYSSAFHDADDSFIVPRCDSPEFVPQMLELCEIHRVDLLVPTIDPELPAYAAARERFAEIGTTVAISSPDVVAIASDKQRTHDWLVSDGFPTVAQSTPAVVRANPTEWPFPLVVKPRFGSASVGVATVHDEAGLNRVVDSAPSGRELIVQRRAAGIEHTIDVMLLPCRVPPNADGRAEHPEVRAVVPRRRIEVRSGEVAKAVTVQAPELIELAEKVGYALPGARGPLNLQVFVTPTSLADDRPGELAVIELNARFGGGVPLSIAAGADMALALLQDALGLPISASLSPWSDNLVMLRYDAAVFVPAPDPRNTAESSPTA